MRQAVRNEDGEICWDRSPGTFQGKVRSLKFTRQDHRPGKGQFRTISLAAVEASKEVVE